MEILVITQYFWPENFRINDLVLGLKEKGYNVTILTGKPNYPSGKIFPGYSLLSKLRDNFDGITVYRVPSVPRGNGRNLRLIMNYFSFIVSACFMAPFLLKGKYDLIFVYEPSPITVMIPAIFLKKIKNVPIMLWVLDLWPESISSTGAIKSVNIIKMVKKLVNYIYHKCDLILVQSQSFIKPIEEYGIKKDKIFYFPNSAEELFYPATKINKEIDTMLPHGFRIMFAGNIGAAQDFGTILSAAEILNEYKEIQFIILGDGRMFNWTKEEINKRNLSGTVHLLGQYSLELMNDFFACADLMLVTLKKSYIFSLTVPGKIQSYLACGRPVIAALDGEGGRIIEESGAGISCPTENAEALAKGILKLFNMPKMEREELGKNGRKYYEINFDRNMLLNKLDQIVHTIY
jgi:glycosyltransferase involved in cell wall biosynthesis